MRYVFLLIALVFISCGNDSKDSKTSENEEVTTTYYLIRHAEKDRATTDNPGLTVQGLKRSANWAKHFKDIELDAVYSTDYKRTLETAAPTAKSKSLTVQLYNAENLYDAAFKEATEGKTVLVVGHSNTTPALVNAILGEIKYQQISDTENGMLYKVVVPEGGETSVTVDKVDM